MFQGQKIEGGKEKKNEKMEQIDRGGEIPSFLRTSEEPKTSKKA